jgi:ribosomal subunit interface protein
MAEAPASPYKVSGTVPLAMRILVRDRGAGVTPALRNHVERRVDLALARFADQIARVVVRFWSSDGRGVGGEKRCQIEVRLRTRDVTVEDLDADPYAASDHAIDRVLRAVARALEREAN